MDGWINLLHIPTMMHVLQALLVVNIAIHPEEEDKLGTAVCLFMDIC